jgi:tocopherol O-methyltransferase
VQQSWPAGIVGFAVERRDYKPRCPETLLHLLPPLPPLALDIGMVGSRIRLCSGSTARARFEDALQTMFRPNQKHKIIEHYEIVSPYYYSLWGEHLHHGYWVRGDESKETAQVQLIEHLARLADVRPGSSVLDIGCGFGGSSLHLARNHGAIPTGITISPIQVQMANCAAARANLKAKFLLMDAEAMHFSHPFDLLWSVESISHYQDPRKFFASAAKLLKPGGTFALTDWFRRENLSPGEKKKYIEPIEKGMFVELHEMDEYAEFLVSSGLRIVHRQVLTPNCAKTWELSLHIIKDRSFWALAAKYGADFVTYLKAFRAMRTGYASGSFVYGLFVAKMQADRDHDA